MLQLYARTVMCAITHWGELRMLTSVTSVHTPQDKTPEDLWVSYAQ
jgi:hypothetical protein